jgi:hypothetical protein
MVLDRFIGSRVGHADPQVRIAAVSRLEATDPLLMECASSDADPGVRRAALARLDDPTALEHAARVDPDAGCRDVAAARLQNVLAGPEGDEPPLAARLELISARCAPELSAFLAEHGGAAPVRIAALKHVSDETLLARVACHDTSAEVRHAALERVQGADALQAIEHATRASDQGISRAARQRLQASRESRQRHAAADALCVRMEALAAGDANALEEAAFHHLEEEWKAGRPSSDDEELVRRYEAARERFRARLAGRTHARQARAPLMAEREALIAELRAAVELDDGLARRITETLDSTQHRWDAITDLDTDDAQRFAALGSQIESQRMRLERTRTNAQPLRALIAEVRAAAEADAPLGRVRLAALERRAVETRRPEDEAVAHALDHELGEALERLRQKQRREQTRAHEETGHIESVAAEMEAALGRGELAAALARYDEAHERLRLVDSKSRASRALKERLERAVPQLKELRDWQRWGVEQTRTNMCVEVESLVGSAEPPEQLARRVRAFRKEWQQLDRASGTTSKTLWERFDRACTRAYEPCAAYFAGQRSARAANLERKQAVIEQLEALDRDTDWNTADWRASERSFHALEREWQATGPVDRALAKGLLERHAVVRKGLDGRFDAKRTDELERRRGLIADLKALLAANDLGEGPARVRAAQTQWSPAVSARRSVEQTLWQEFRAACDEIYARLHARRNAAAEEQRAATNLASALCERAEALARDLEATPAEDGAVLAAAISRGRAELSALRGEFAQAPRAPRGAEAKVGQRFRSACAAVERVVALRREALERVEQQRDAERARLCRELERQVLAASADDALGAALERARAEWSELPPSSSGSRDALEKRFVLACAAAGDAAERARLAGTLSAQADEKRSLCLRAEIVAGVPSPLELAAARRSYQAQWMQDSLRGTSRWPSSEREKLEEARRIETRWLELSGTPDDDELETRYRAALSALRRATGSDHR